MAGKITRRGGLDTKSSAVKGRTGDTAWLAVEPSKAVERELLGEEAVSDSCFSEFSSMRPTYHSREALSYRNGRRVSHLKIASNRPLTFWPCRGACSPLQHINNHEIHRGLKRTLDPAFAALVRHLRERDQWENTIVVCGGEFGRSPQINPAGGRDHWARGFSVAIAGGGLRTSVTVGETDPSGQPLEWGQGTTIADIHATVLQTLGIHPATELDTLVGRPIKLCEGKPILALVNDV